MGRTWTDEAATVFQQKQFVSIYHAGHPAIQHKCQLKVITDTAPDLERLHMYHNEYVICRWRLPKQLAMRYVTKDLSDTWKRIPVVGEALVSAHLSELDCELLGPQVGFEANNYFPKFEQAGVPCAVIDMRNYGMVDGANVMQKALDMIEAAKNK